MRFIWQDFKIRNSIWENSTRHLGHAYHESLWLTNRPAGAGPGFACGLFLNNPAGWIDQE